MKTFTTKTRSARSLGFTALGVFFLCLPGCESEEQTRSTRPEFDGQKAYAEVEALIQFSPRDAGKLRCRFALSSGGGGNAGG